jgi:hypothetical protein
MAARVVQATRMVWHRNPLSGHEWYTHEYLEKWEVHSSFSPTSTHRSEEAADREAAARDAFDAKYPFQCPRTERELRWLERTHTAS